MSFTFEAPKTQPNVTSNAPAPATFSFGATGAGDAGKTLSPGFPLMSNTPQSKPGLFNNALTSTPVQNTGLSFGAISTSAPTLANPATPQQAPGLTFGAATTPNTGISFGAPNVTPTAFPAPAAPSAAPSFGLASTTAAAPPPVAGLTFGSVRPGAGTGFSLGGGEGASPAPVSGLTFGAQSAMTTGTGFSLGSTPTATTTSSTTTSASGFNLGANMTVTTASLDPTKTSTVQTGFSAAPTTATLQPDSGFGTSTANTTASTGFSLGGTGTTSASTGFSFGASTTANTTGFSLNKTVSAVAPTSLATPSTQLSLGTTTTVSSSASGVQSAPINFFQLEESINKWTLELEEQEKVFVNQATQVNAWDKLLITNGEKIVILNQEVERVKIEQQQLEHELDYVVGQQKELEDCLVPLKKELDSLSVSDPEREYTYRLAENLDTQLKRMSEDLKEIIEHLNQANRTQDSSDPIVQIGKILNAHMNSLQWLDQQTALLSQKIQQIDQMHQNFRQENERSFNLAYN